VINRRRFVLLGGALAFARFAPTAAQEATPADVDLDDADADVGVLSVASRAFNAPATARTGTLTLNAVAMEFDSPESAATLFPQMFDVVAFGMQDGGEDYADVPAPAIGDGAAARVRRLEGDGGSDGDAVDEAAVGFRVAGAIVIVVTASTDGSAVADAIRTAENAARRASAPAASPAAGEDGPRTDGAFAFLPTLADVPAGMVLVDEDGSPADDAGTPVP
jgi:hypothetical protein